MSIINPGINTNTPIGLPEGLFVGHSFGYMPCEGVLTRISEDYGVPVPRLITPTAALKRALQLEFPASKGFLVRPLKNKDKNGFEVLLETKGEKRNELTHIGSYAIEMNGDTGKLTSVTSDGHSSVVNDIADKARELMACSSPALMAEWWVNFLLLPKLDALRLMPTGGMYFVPIKHMQAVEDLVDDLSDAKVASGRVSFVVQRCAMSPVTAEGAVQCVEDQFHHQLEAIRKNLSTGTLGTRAIKTQTDLLQATLERLAEYRTMLNRPIGVLDSSVAETKKALAAVVAERKAKSLEEQAAKKGDAAVLADIF